MDPNQECPYEDVLEVTGSPEQAQAGHGFPNQKRRLSENDIDEKEAEAERKKLILQCMLLECGILFHSVFIGMSSNIRIQLRPVVRKIKSNLALQACLSLCLLEMIRLCF